MSDSAPACPSCGRPIVATTIEHTGKPIKAAKALGCAGFVVGAIFVIWGATDFSSLLTLVGFFLTFGAGITYVSATILKWWRHD